MLYVYVMYDGQLNDNTETRDAKLCINEQGFSVNDATKHATIRIPTSDVADEVSQLCLLF